MAFLYIAEYETLARDVKGASAAPIVDEGSLLAEYVIANAGVNTVGPALNARTKIVRLHSDSICSIAYDSAPVATTSKKRMAAGQTEYFGVNGADLKKFAAILNV